MTQAAGTALVPWSPAPRRTWPRLAVLVRQAAARLRGQPVRETQPAPAPLLDGLAAEADDAASALRAGQVLAAYAAADEQARGVFFEALLGFGPDRAALRRAALDFARDPSDDALHRLQAVADSPRQGILRRLNGSTGGTAALVSMRADLLRRLADRPDLGVVDADFAHLFASWFNRGFLALRRIDWSTPAAVLERLIRYEAVHAINGWDDLRRRLDLPDRRCFAFFHPNLPDEPLIFVEVALMREMPAAIGPILAGERTPVPAGAATTAVFYSISNCQAGLRGIAFGNLLIKQAVLELRAELPGLRAFCTLSPVPGLVRWAGKEGVLVPPPGEGAALARLGARYLLQAKGDDGLPLDPVARFHLSNGARLERVNPGADESERGMAASAGLMVNYVYEPAEVAANKEAFSRNGSVAASRKVRALAA